MGKSPFYRWSNVKIQSWTGNPIMNKRWIVGRQFYLCKTVYWFPYSKDLLRSHLLDSTIHMPLFHIEIHCIRDLVWLWCEWIYWQTYVCVCVWQCVRGNASVNKNQKCLLITTYIRRNECVTYQKIQRKPFAELLGRPPPYRSWAQTLSHIHMS